MRKFILNLILEVIISLLLFFVLSIIMSLTSISEKLIIPITIVITFLSVFIGGFNYSKFKGKNGIIHGGLLGISYIFLIYIISSNINSDFRLGLNSIIMIVVSIFGSAIGGITGVNIS